jgi:hypothetical protein
MSEKLLRLIFALLNMLGIVGVGTYLAGHKRVGCIQISISLIALALSVLPLFYLAHLIQQDGFGFIQWYIGLFTGSSRIEANYLPPFLVMLAGVVLFAVNLAWSFTTTKPVQATPPPLP